MTAPLFERSICYAIERKQTEQKIREQAALLDVATNAIFVCDLDEKILFWNKAAESLYSWKKEEAINKKTRVLWHEKHVSQVEKALSIMMKNGSWEGELHQKTKLGKENYCKLLAQPKIIRSWALGIGNY